MTRALRGCFWATMGVCFAATTVVAGTPDENAAKADGLKTVMVIEFSKSMQFPKSADGQLIGSLYGQNPETVRRKCMAALSQMGPFSVVQEETPEEAQEQAAASKAGYIVHIVLLSRRVATTGGAGGATFYLKASCTIYRSSALAGTDAATVKWRKAGAGTFSVQGFQSSLGGSSEYERLASLVKSLLLRQVCAYKIKAAIPSGNTVRYKLAVMNKGTRTITSITLAVPTKNPYIDANGTAQVSIAPGEEKTVTVTVKISETKKDMKHREARISDMNFEIDGGT